MARVAPLAAALALAGCVVGARPLELPDDCVATVAVVSDALPEAMGQVGRHSWIAVREEGATHFYRYEVLGQATVHSGDPFEGTGGDDVRLHGIMRGPPAVAFIQCLKEETRRYNEEHEYGFWPGPNCNTYVDEMARHCGMHAELPATSVGRDYRGVVGVSRTTEGTGVQLESPVLGAKLGFTEGFEVHLFALALGIDLWPPAIIVPLGPGRLGFDDR
jgi:hypothetical protein